MRAHTDAPKVHGWNCCFLGVRKLNCVHVLKCVNVVLWYLLVFIGRYFDTDWTIRLWEDCYSPHSVPGDGYQNPGMDQPIQFRTIQQQSARRGRTFSVITHSKHRWTEQDNGSCNVWLWFEWTSVDYRALLYLCSQRFLGIIESKKRNNESWQIKFKT